MRLLLTGDCRNFDDVDHWFSTDTEERLCYVTMRENDRGITLRSADDEILRRLLKNCGGWES